MSGSSLNSVSARSYSKADSSRELLSLTPLEGQKLSSQDVSKNEITSENEQQKSQTPKSERNEEAKASQSRRQHSPESRGKLVLNAFILVTKAQCTHPRDVVVANLSGMKIVEADPTDFKLFTNLVELDLSENNNFPLEQVASFPQLMSLSCACNNLNHINLNADSTAGFLKLETLDLSYNRINQETDILALGSLPALRNLILAGNEISKFPKVGPGSFLKLKALDLEGNFVKDKESFSNIGALPKLRALNLKRNEIRRFTLSSDVMICYPHLEELYLNDNKIKDVAGILQASRIEPLKKLILLNNPIIYNDYMIQVEMLKFAQKSRAQVYCFEEVEKSTGLSLNRPKLKRIGLKTSWNVYKIPEHKYISPLMRHTNNFIFPLEETFKYIEEFDDGMTSSQDVVLDNSAERLNNRSSPTKGSHRGSQGRALDSKSPNQMSSKKSDGGTSSGNVTPKLSSSRDNFFITGVNFNDKRRMSASPDNDLARLREAVNKSEDPAPVAPEEPHITNLAPAEAYKILKKAIDVAYEDKSKNRIKSQVEKLMRMAKSNPDKPLTELEIVEDKREHLRPKRLTKKRSDLKILENLMAEVDERLNILEFNLSNVTRSKLLKHHMPQTHLMLREVQMEYERLQSILIPKNIPVLPPTAIQLANNPETAKAYTHNFNLTSKMVDDLKVKKKKNSSRSGTGQASDERRPSIIDKIRKEMTEMQ